MCRLVLLAWVLTGLVVACARLVGLRVGCLVRLLVGCLVGLIAWWIVLVLLSTAAVRVVIVMFVGVVRVVVTRLRAVGWRTFAWWQLFFLVCQLVLQECRVGLQRHLLLLFLQRRKVD